MTVQWYEVSNTLLTMSNFSNLDIQYEHCDLMLHFTKILEIQPFLKKGNSTNVC